MASPEDVTTATAAPTSLLACLETPALPLQLLLKQKPEWRTLPVAVISEDRPQGIVTWLNPSARTYRILPGQTYATALGLCRDLRASTVPPAAIGACIATLLTLLRTFSPRIEPAEDEPGVFWIDTRGLIGLWSDYSHWARTLLDALATENLSAVIVVGFSHFGTYAAARSLAIARAQPPRQARKAAPDLLVFSDPKEERRLIDRVPLAYLAIEASVRQRLDRLGVRRLGELVALPAAGIAKRYGPLAYRLHRLASGELTRALAPMPELIPARSQHLLEFQEHDAHRLLFQIKTIIDGLLPRLELRQTVVTELVLELGFEGKKREQTEFERHIIRPAAATLDTSLLLDLVRLRLENIDLQRGVVELRLELCESPANPEQARLFNLARRRDTSVAARALARIQAELGAEAVAHCVLRDGHLPIARQTFEPFSGTLPEPRPTLTNEPKLVRRVYSQPEPMPPRPRNLRNDGWLTRLPEAGPITGLYGPYVTSGGWWRTPGSEVHRDYYFAETIHGTWLWIFYDKHRRRWFEEGVVQ